MNELKGFSSLLAGHSQKSYGKTLFHISVPHLSISYLFSISFWYLLAAARSVQTTQVPEEIVFS